LRQLFADFINKALMYHLQSAGILLAENYAHRPEHSNEKYPVRCLSGCGANKLYEWTSSDDYGDPADSAGARDIDNQLEIVDW